MIRLELPRSSVWGALGRFSLIVLVIVLFVALIAGAIWLATLVAPHKEPVASLAVSPPEAIDETTGPPEPEKTVPVLPPPEVRRSPRRRQRARCAP